MNSLTSLLKICHQLPDERDILEAYEAERFKLQTPQGKNIADVGCEPILHMRHFQVRILFIFFDYWRSGNNLLHERSVQMQQKDGTSIFWVFFFWDSVILILQAKKELPEKLVYQVLGPHGNGKSLSISWAGPGMQAGFGLNVFSSKQIWFG